MKAPQYEETYDNETWKPIVETVQQYCLQIAENPMRSNHVKVRTMKKVVKSDFSHLSDHQLEHYLGATLTGAPYTEKWGKETYEIDVDELMAEIFKDASSEGPSPKADPVDEAVVHGD